MVQSRPVRLVDNHNCRGSPPQSRGPSLTLHSSCQLQWKDKPSRMPGSEGQWGICGRTCQQTKDSPAHQPPPEKSASSQQKSPQSKQGHSRACCPGKGRALLSPGHFLNKRIDVCVFITESLYYTPLTNTTL